MMQSNEGFGALVDSGLCNYDAVVFIEQPGVRLSPFQLTFVTHPLFNYSCMPLI